MKNLKELLEDLLEDLDAVCNSMKESESESILAGTCMELNDIINGHEVHGEVGNIIPLEKRAVVDFLVFFAEDWLGEDFEDKEALKKIEAAINKFHQEVSSL